MALLLPFLLGRHGRRRWRRRLRAELDVLEQVFACCCHGHGHARVDGRRQRLHGRHRVQIHARGQVRARHGQLLLVKLLLLLLSMLVVVVGVHAGSILEVAMEQCRIWRSALGVNRRDHEGKLNFGDRWNREPVSGQSARATILRRSAVG